MSNKNDLVRVEVVAERLGISIPQTYRLAKAREIPCVRIGPRVVRFDPRDVEEYIREHRRGKSKAA